jgi:hypothetical protein
MKLYTEEHLKLFYQLGKFDGIARRETDVEEEIKNHLPIELPSDEEIDKEIEWLDNPLERLNFKAGIKWMRDKIRIQGR